jgi:hypothetical protein
MKRLKAVVLIVTATVVLLITATVVFLITALLTIASAEEPKYKNYPCPQCHYSTVIETPTAMIMIIVRGQYKFQETRINNTCDGCGWNWYSTKSECLGRVYGNDSTDRSRDVQQSTGGVSQITDRN